MIANPNNRESMGVSFLREPLVCGFKGKAKGQLQFCGFSKRDTPMFSLSRPYLVDLEKDHTVGGPNRGAQH